MKSLDNFTDNCKTLLEDIPEKVSFLKAYEFLQVYEALFALGSKNNVYDFLEQGIQYLKKAKQYFPEGSQDEENVRLSLEVIGFHKRISHILSSLSEFIQECEEEIEKDLHPELLVALHDIRNCVHQTRRKLAEQSATLNPEVKSDKEVSPKAPLHLHLLQRAEGIVFFFKAAICLLLEQENRPQMISSSPYDIPDPRNTLNPSESVLSERPNRSLSVVSELSVKKPNVQHPLHPASGHRGTGHRSHHKKRD